MHILESLLKALSAGLDSMASLVEVALPPSSSALPLSCSASAPTLGPSPSRASSPFSATELSGDTAGLAAGLGADAALGVGADAGAGVATAGLASSALLLGFLRSLAVVSLAVEEEEAEYAGLL